MSSQNYGFVLNMWKMKKVDANKVRAYSRLYLTSSEVESILATPQLENYETQPTQPTGN